MIHMKTFTKVVILQLALAVISHAEEPKDLTALRESWQKAQKAALEPVDRRYAEALNVLRARFTKEGNLDSVLAVQGELDSLAANGDGKLKITFVPARCAEPFPVGHIEQGQIAASADPTEVFNGKTVIFDLTKGKLLRFKIESPTPVRKISYTGIAFKNFKMEARPKAGKAVSVAPPIEGNSLHTVVLDVPDLRNFELTVNTEMALWVVVKSILLE